MKLFTSVLILIISISCRGQVEEKFNLGFEDQETGNDLSDGWFQWGDHILTIDSMAHTGARSGKITSTQNGDFGSIAYKIPAKYQGKSITLEGYMKTKDVHDGFVGLLMRIDGNGSALEFDNMQKQNITGTNDWTKYTITLPYPKGAEYIYVAGILVGKGEAWFDDFTLTIDGNDIQTLKEVERELAKAELDKEFDSGSKIDLSNVTPNGIENLELLGRVWGFLKYHHPEIAKGNYNWDYELFRFLPKYVLTKSEVERNTLLIEWIDSLGDLKNCSKCEPTSEDAVIRPDHNWIEDQDAQLKEKLLDVYNSRSQGKHYYIGMAPGVRNPIFKNEEAYYLMPFPDDGYRLLALYRFWNMIHYFFPYRHLTDKDWNTVLGEYIPIFLNAKNELEYEMAAIQLIGDVQDTHANIWEGAGKLNAWKGSNYPPVHTRFIENQLVVTDFYNEEHRGKVGLEIGDVITEINDIPVSEIVEEKAKYYPASNYPTMLRDISMDLLRSNSDEIEIKVQLGENKVKIKSLKLYPKDSLDIYRWYRRDDRKSFKLLDNNIGYVTLQTIKDEDISEIKKQFRDTKGIIMDIRNYPSKFVPFVLGNYFVSSATPFVKFTHGSVDNPGEFTFEKELKIPSKGDTYQGKLVVLVNELTQSQAEYTSMAFRAGDNTTIIGSTTAGADGNVSPIYLPGGMRTMISGIGVYYPNGEETQRVGIVPDIEVKPTILGIRQGKDELLEKAIEIIKKEE
ncbi:MULTISPECIES: S41 family peptidase [Flagellimonas]|uniref:Peptidase S41 n=1 Tax=Flagellimonas hadalis TaxID=2597517 RepID=A0A5N5IS31_9FLAO|nr:S41 family peptidase [Allomuricauda hadalis]KAB5487526.1 peptidase S41 [Allomuricauda hadalis]RUA29557.1 MAG: peptidase S41 [Bacteroidota bacterium]